MVSDEAWKKPVDHDHVVALRAVEKVILDHSVPAAFSELLVTPWMGISQELLQLHGELSDTWVRMLWFTRKVCTSISTSLTAADPEPLDHVLQTFMLWLQGLNQGTGSFDQVTTAAEHLCGSLKTQMMVDLSRDDMTDVDDTAAAGSSQPNPNDLNPNNLAPTDLAPIDLATPTITMNVSEAPMDIPTVSDNGNTDQNKEPEFKAPSDPAPVADKTAVGTSDSLLIPVGVWLGFHDEDASMMAKLAVYDRANGNYIFANKQGFLVRQVNTPDLLHLIENELVDIIERRLVPRVTKT